MPSKLTITVYAVRHPRGDREAKKRWKVRRQWRWRIQSRNRVIIGASSESFNRLSGCLNNLDLVTGIRIWPDDYGKKFADKTRFTAIVRGRATSGQPVML